MMALIAILLGVTLQGATDRTDYVPFCEIVEHPDRYDQKSVLTSGIYQAGPEFGLFVDPDCVPTPERDVATSLGSNGKRVRDTRASKRMDQILDRDKLVFVVVRGIFDAYNRDAHPVPADPRFQKFFNQPGRFGHLGISRFQLRIESVEFAAPVSKLGLPAAAGRASSPDLAGADQR